MFPATAIRRWAVVALISSVLTVVAARTAAANTITLSWSPNPPSENVAGYKLYIGTESGMYDAPIYVGNVTTYAFTDAIPGQAYFFAIAAYNALGATSALSYEVSATAGAVVDVTAPTISITGPVSSTSYSTTATSVTLSGRASDNVGIAQVTWPTSTGPSGTASGTDSWTGADIPLMAGNNV